MSVHSGMLTGPACGRATRNVIAPEASDLSAVLECVIEVSARLMRIVAADRQTVRALLERIAANERQREDLKRYASEIEERLARAARAKRAA